MYLEMDKLERGIDKLFFGFLKEAKLYVHFRNDCSLHAKYYSFKKCLLKEKNIGTFSGLALMFARVYTAPMPSAYRYKRIYYSQLFRFYLLKHVDEVADIFGKSKLAVVADIIRVIERNMMNSKIHEIFKYYKKTNKIKIEKNYEYYTRED